MIENPARATNYQLSSIVISESSRYEAVLQLPKYGKIIFVKDKLTGQKEEFIQASSSESDSTLLDINLHKTTQRRPSPFEFDISCY